MNAGTGCPFEYYAVPGGASNPGEHGDSLRGFNETSEGLHNVVHQGGDGQYRERAAMRADDPKILRIRVLFWRAQARLASERGAADNGVQELGVA